MRSAMTSIRAVTTLAGFRLTHVDTRCGSMSSFGDRVINANPLTLDGHPVAFVASSCCAFDLREVNEPESSRVPRLCVVNDRNVLHRSEWSENFHQSCLVGCWAQPENSDYARLVGILAGAVVASTTMIAWASWVRATAVARSVVVTSSWLSFRSIVSRSASRAAGGRRAWWRVTSLAMASAIIVTTVETWAHFFRNFQLRTYFDDSANRYELKVHSKVTQIKVARDQGQEKREIFEAFWPFFLRDDLDRFGSMNTEQEELTSRCLHSDLQTSDHFFMVVKKSWMKYQNTCMNKTRRGCL